MTGRLVVVGTPIGNLGDLSPRAADALAGVDVIVCEDTRRTATLLRHVGRGQVPMVVVNEHTEHDVTASLVDRIVAGAVVVLVSDAGMPVVSDPGGGLIAAVVVAGLAVEVVPGPTAAVTAVALSGLDAGRFVFEGFLPRKGAVRTERLAALVGEPRAIVLYEAPHRLARTLADLASTLGDDRPVSWSREMTKLHEETWRGTLGGAVAEVADRVPRGEYVVVVQGAPAAGPVDDDRIVADLQRLLDVGLSRRDAVDRVVAELGVPRNRVYALATTR